MPLKHMGQTCKGRAVYAHELTPDVFRHASRNRRHQLALLRTRTLIKCRCWFCSSVPRRENSRTSRRKRAARKLVAVLVADASCPASARAPSIPKQQEHAGTARVAWTDRWRPVYARHAPASDGRLPVYGSRKRNGDPLVGRPSCRARAALHQKFAVACVKNYC